MKKMNFQISRKKPEIEVNKPPVQKIWQKQGLFFIWYFIIFAVIFLLWGFLSRKMGSAGMNFLNIGKKRVFGPCCYSFGRQACRGNCL